MTLGVDVLGLSENYISFEGRGFRANLNPSTLAFTGQGFVSEMTARVEVNMIDFTGRGYKVTPEFLGGFIFTGQSYLVDPTFALTPDYNVNFTGRGYAAALNAVLETETPIEFTGRGYKVTPEFLGGFWFTGRGYSATLTATVGTSEVISFTGRGYSASLTALAVPVTDISFTGRGYSASIVRNEFTGRGYAVSPVFTLAVDAAYAEAFVMNLTGNQVTRYQNYPFSHIARIGDTYYGINETGVYTLDGDNDIDETTPVNGTILTNSDDFNTFQSKNVAYVYVDGDDDYTITPIVDDVEQPSYTSGFSGRRVKMARGNKGRYWAFRIEGIRRLQGMEYRPDNITRRVK